MQESHITISSGGITFSGDDAMRLFNAVTLRAGLRLLQHGIRPAKGWTVTRGLAMATALTGKPYKRSQIDKARADLQIWIDTMRAALPVEHRDSGIR